MLPYFVSSMWLIAGVYNLTSGLFNFRLRLFKPVVDISIGRKWSNIIRVVSGLFLIVLSIWYTWLTQQP